MKQLSLFCLLFFCLSQFSAAPAQDNLKISQAGVEKRKYLPGDVVHIVIEAPFDTARITAIMPDRERIKLSLDRRRTDLWHGYWEVPVGLKRGSYSAKLIAADLEEKSFEGVSAPFFIGEPKLALLMQLKPAEEKQQKIAAKPRVKPKKKRVVRRRLKPKRMVRARPSKNMVRLMVSARDYMAKQQYTRAKAQLKALLKISPDNSEIKMMLKRLETVIRAKKMSL